MLFGGLKLFYAVVVNIFQLFLTPISVFVSLLGLACGEDIESGKAL